MMIQKAIHKSADASKNEWVPKSEIESLRSKLERWEKYYKDHVTDYDKHDSPDREFLSDCILDDLETLKAKLEKAKDSLGEIWKVCRGCDFESAVHRVIPIAKQTLKDIEGE